MINEIIQNRGEAIKTFFINFRVVNVMRWIETLKTAYKKSK